MQSVNGKYGQIHLLFPKHETEFKILLNNRTPHQIGLSFKVNGVRYPLIVLRPYVHSEILKTCEMLGRKFKFTEQDSTAARSVLADYAEKNDCHIKDAKDVCMEFSYLIYIGRPRLKENNAFLLSSCMTTDGVKKTVQKDSMDRMEEENDYDEKEFCSSSDNCPSEVISHDRTDCIRKKPGVFCFRNYSHQTFHRCHFERDPCWHSRNLVLECCYNKLPDIPHRPAFLRA